MNEVGRFPWKAAFVFCYRWVAMPGKLWSYYVTQSTDLIATYIFRVRWA